MAVEDVDLRLHDVDARDLLGDGVLDLDARVHLDEVEGARVGIHQELDGAGAHIVRRRADGARIGGQFPALGVVEIGGRRALDDLLVAPLDRAVALEEIDHGAVGVAEDLHLDVAGALDELLEIDLVLAESGLGLALGLRHLARQILCLADRAHAAPAAAPGGLEHQRVADRLGEALHLLHVLGSGSVAGTTGTPTSTARLRAATLLPRRRIVSAVGPMKTMPASAQASANSGFPTGDRSPGGSRPRPIPWRPGSLPRSTDSSRSVRDRGADAAHGRPDSSRRP